MPLGPLLAVGGVYSVKVPEVVTRPIFPLLYSSNQSAPSGPLVMSYGWLFALE